jgi:hypothetical protein
MTAQLYLPITDGRVDVDNDALHPGATGAREPIDSQEDDIAAAETAALVVRAPRPHVAAKRTTGFEPATSSLGSLRSTN